MALSEPTTSSRRVRSVVFAAIGMLMVWPVLSHSLVAYLANAAPESALVLRSNDPTALINIAERRLNLDRPAKEPSAATPVEGSGRIPAFARYARKTIHTETGLSEAAPDNKSDNRSGGKLDNKSDSKDETKPTERLPSNAADLSIRQEIRALTRLALAHDPLNAHALRILGQIADAADEDEAAARFMQAAAHRSLRESVAVFWLMREAFETKDYATAVRYADVLLRSRPEVAPQVVPTLARIAENKDANAELKNVLAQNPPWRALFFSNLLRSITDARTPLDLLLSIKDTPTPPTTADLRDYLNLLIQNKYQELAYYVWLQFLPREQLARTGLLFNGSFEVAPSSLPFDWVFSPGSGVTIEFARREDEPGQRALLVEFGQGRVDFRGVAQMVMLAPGSYELKGQYKGKLVGRRGLEWRVICADATNPLAKSAMFTGLALAWTDFSVPFTVPDTECRAQQIRLVLDARSASEQLITGAAWYDKLEIVRAQ